MGNHAHAQILVTFWSSNLKSSVLHIKKLDAVQFSELGVGSSW
jgi:hypothetical protein